MRNCGNCANYNHERLCHTDVCAKCFIEGANGKCGTPSKWKSKPLTNADRIRAMTDEELADFLWGFDYEAASKECEGVCTLRRLISWLKQPAKEET